MPIPVTLDELQRSDEISVRYYTKPGHPDSAVECCGPFSVRGVTMFRTLEVEYIKVGLTPVLVGSIISIERVVTDGAELNPAGRQRTFCCTFNRLTEQQIAVLGEFSEEVKREPPATSFYVGGFVQIERLRDAATKLGLGEPAVTRWSREELQ